jgi:hypothetical protein
VIIDSLRRINAGREISENSAEFADQIYELKELLTRYGASGIIIHHANKNPDATAYNVLGAVHRFQALYGASGTFSAFLKLE